MISVKAYYKQEASFFPWEDSADDLMFETEAQARSFCSEEVKWESCERVVCEQLGIDVKGDFAS